jgi:methylmalonyl-CoA/ethylmalonyl-CoA epimerase
VILGIDHLGIAVRSIAEGRAFYEALGLGVEEIEEVAAEQVRVAMIPCGGVRIELLEPTSPESPIARFLERRGPGLHHVCLASDDLAADDARLRGGGFRLLRPEPTRGAGGSWVQFVHPQSAGGVLVELSQAAPAAEPLAAPGAEPRTVPVSEPLAAARAREDGG